MKRVSALSLRSSGAIRALPFLILAFATPSILPVDPVAAQAQRKPDLADRVAGTWEGDVIADARGSSQSDVVITVKRISKNLVEVSSDYSRIPTVQIPLSQAGDAILAARPPHNFLIELHRDPNRLDLSIDGVTLLVRR